MKIHDTSIPKKVYTVLWKDGHSELIKGHGFHHALKEAGLGSGAVKAVDFYSEGDTRKDYAWDEEAKSWETINNSVT